MTELERMAQQRWRPAVEQEHDRLCDIPDPTAALIRAHGFNAVRSAITTQRGLLREQFRLNGAPARNAAESGGGTPQAISGLGY